MQHARYVSWENSYSQTPLDQRDSNNTKSVCQIVCLQRTKYSKLEDTTKPLDKIDLSLSYLSCIVDSFFLLIELIDLILVAVNCMFPYARLNLTTSLIICYILCVMRYMSWSGHASCLGPLRVLLWLAHMDVVKSKISQISTVLT